MASCRRRRYNIMGKRNGRQAAAARRLGRRGRAGWTKAVCHQLAPCSLAVHHRGRLCRQGAGGKASRALLGMHTLPQQRRAAPTSSRCCASGSCRAAGHRQACQRSPSPAKAHTSQHPHPRRTGVGLREGGMALALAAGAVQAGSRERARRAGLRPAKVKPPQAADAQGGGGVRMLGEGMAMAGCWHRGGAGGGTQPEPAAGTGPAAFRVLVQPHPALQAPPAPTAASSLLPDDACLVAQLPGRPRGGHVLEVRRFRAHARRGSGACKPQVDGRGRGAAEDGQHGARCGLRAARGDQRAWGVRHAAEGRGSARKPAKCQRAAASGRRRAASRGNRAEQGACARRY